MAIDTRDKRASVLMVDLEFGRVWPNPDGALADVDRQHLGYLYRGLSTIGVKLLAFERAVARRIHGRLWGRIN